VLLLGGPIERIARRLMHRPVHQRDEP
jgi:hypothetical protein